ncbi:hypothetical protein KAZ01_00375 [Candidatus Gracilibacteria bacterium]|nr:hypothetical protein [Candidatus Gracilibacteria bacterium]
MIGIVTFNKSAGDKIIELYGLEFDNKNPSEHFDVFRKANIVLIMLKSTTKKNEREALIFLYTEFNPKIIFYFGLSSAISNEHIIGDVVLPNTFLKYNNKIDQNIEFTKENRDVFMSDPIFIEHYITQKDYDFTKFGFSIGGICVSGNFKFIESEEHREKIQIAYEADTYDNLSYILVEEAKNLDILDKIYVIQAIEKGSSNPNFKKENIQDFAIENGINILKFMIDNLEITD